MKKIAIISQGYFWTPIESGPTRFFQIASTFAKSGHDVEVITTDFQHFDKCKRDINSILKEHYPFKITFIHAPAYKKNLDIRRIYSNFVISGKIAKYLSEHISEYSAVYCSIPANNVAAKVTKVCHDYSIPCVIDVEDLWPEAMEMVIKSRLVRKLFLKPFLKDAEKAYRYASGIIGTSEDYTARAFKYQSRKIPYDTVYVGCDLEVFDSGVEQYIGEIDKPTGEFWITYAGSISTSYDIGTLIMAVDKLYNAGHTDIKLQLLGTGSLKDELEEMVKTKNIKNVRFWGFTPYKKMAAVLARSDVVINSFVKGAPQSIVNKVGDYLASGRPMINTLENPIFCDLVNKYNVGINIEPEKVDVLADAILKLRNDEDMRKKMGENARNLAETEFDRKVSYKRIVEMVEKVKY